MSIDELWATAPRATAVFVPEQIKHLPEPVQRYFLYTLAPGTPLSTAVRIEMHGSIRLSQQWWPFCASQVLRWDRGFIWKARVAMHGLPVTGFDRLVDGEGATRWRMLGLIPIAKGHGLDITRSAAGRLHVEACWLPAVLLGPDVVWETGSATDAQHARAVIRAHGETSRLELTLDETGAIQGLRLPRWSDLGGGPFHYEDFGGMATAPRTFGGVTLPTQYRAGWYYGSDRFESEGEFWRSTFDSVEYR